MHGGSVIGEGPGSCWGSGRRFREGRARRGSSTQEVFKNKNLSPPPAHSSIVQGPLVGAPLSPPATSTVPLRIRLSFSQLNLYIAKPAPQCGSQGFQPLTSKRVPHPSTHTLPGLQSIPRPHCQSPHPHPVSSRGLSPVPGNSTRHKELPRSEGRAFVCPRSLSTRNSCGVSARNSFKALCFPDIKVDANWILFASKHSYSGRTFSHVCKGYEEHV